ncbi:carboxypeptidase regulatory-like domain-containing protein [candidate division KSB1 bacterium]|nr:carboxypeptidase regulatory-like domain-containing protein [candidate division KSB1 bacterium]
MSKKIALIGITIILFIFNCFKKQDHDILVPKTPIYNISGTVYCSVSHQTIPDADVILTGEVKYNEEDTSRTIQFYAETDENGVYTFTDVPANFTYEITASKTGYFPQSVECNFTYTNRNADDIILGKLLVIQNEYQYEDVDIKGLTHKDKNIWIADGKNSQLIEFDESMEIKRSIRFPNYHLFALEWDGEWFWTSDYYKKVIIQFQIIAEDSIEIYSLYPLPNSLEDEGQVYTINDFAYLKSIFWACAREATEIFIKLLLDYPNSIYVSYYDIPMQFAKGIEVTDDTLYLVCQHGAEARMYLLNRPTMESSAFYVVPNGAGMTKFDETGIWVATGNKITQYSF